MPSTTRPVVDTLEALKKSIAMARKPPAQETQPAQPTFGQTGQFLLIGKGLNSGGSSGGFLGGSERTDVIFGVDRENHFQSPMFRTFSRSWT
jgi:hypothetical protein